MDKPSLRQQIADETESLMMLLETTKATTRVIKVALAELGQRNPTKIDQAVALDLGKAIQLLNFHHDTSVALLKRSVETLDSVAQTITETAAA